MGDHWLALSELLSIFSLRLKLNCGIPSNLSYSLPINEKFTILPLFTIPFKYPNKQSFCEWLYSKSMNFFKSGKSFSLNDQMHIGNDLTSTVM